MRGASEKESVPFAVWWDEEHGATGRVGWPSLCGDLGDTTTGSRGIVDGAMLVVTFSTRDLSLRVAMALGTVKD